MDMGGGGVGGDQTDLRNVPSGVQMTRSLNVPDLCDHRELLSHFFFFNFD